MRAALVTGAARGLGLAIARELHACGCGVVLADVDLHSATRLAEELDPAGDRAAAIALDVRSPESFGAALDAVAERFKSVDVLVNNAARTSAAPFFQIPLEEWDDVLAVNLRGVYLGLRLGGARMRDAGYGRIVNLTSLAGLWGRSPTGAHYAASKAGIVALTRIAATHLAPHGVTVNAVAPGPIDGPQVQAMAPEAVRAYVEKSVPLRRLGRPAEVAALVAFLCSDDAGFITGATYDVNGGALMR